MGRTISILRPGKSYYASRDSYNARFLLASPTNSFSVAGPTVVGPRECEEICQIRKAPRRHSCKTVLRHLRLKMP